MHSQSFSDLKRRFGKDPDLILTPTSEEKRLSDEKLFDMANEYIVFMSDEATGGCVVYGRYGQDPEEGWQANPSARWPLAEMIRRFILPHSIG